MHRHVTIPRNHKGPVTCVAARAVEDRLWIASTGNDNIILVTRLRLDGTQTVETDEIIQLGTGAYNICK